MTKKELIEKLSLAFPCESERVAERLISEGIVTVEPEPELVDYYMVKHRGSIYEAFTNRVEAEANLTAYTTASMELGLDYVPSLDRLSTTFVFLFWPFFSCNFVF